MEGGFRDALSVRPARAGEEDVESPEALGDRRRVLLHLRLVADVALEEERRACPRFARVPSETRDIAVHDRDLGPLAREEPNGGEPDARRPARHHRDLPVQSSRHPSVLVAPSLIGL